MERIKQLIAGLLVVFFMTSNLSGFVYAEEFSICEQIVNETLVQTDDANEMLEDVTGIETSEQNNSSELSPENAESAETYQENISSEVTDNSEENNFEDTLSETENSVPSEEIQTDIIFNEKEIIEELPEDVDSEDETEELPLEEVELLEEDDFEVELAWWWGTSGIYETKNKNTKCWTEKGSDATYKNSKVTRKIASAGTVVKITDTDTNKSWNWWCKTKEGDWIWADNLKKHKHSGPTPSSSTKYKSVTNTKHYPIISTGKQVCTKCKNAGFTSESVMKKASTDEQWWNWQDHDWNSTGVCKKNGCGHKFDYNVKSASGTYIVLSDITLRSAPYSASGSKGTVSKGELVTMKSKTDNAFGNLWYKTSSGGWVYYKNVEKHDHDYRNTDGYCSCGASYNYDKKTCSMSATAYEAKNNGVVVRNRPYSGASQKYTLSAGDVITINGYTYSDPKHNWFSNDRWYRVKGGGWVFHEHVKTHTKHNCSAGKCQNSGCTYEFPIETSYYNNTKCFETIKADVTTRVKPYSNTTKVSTIGQKGTIVKVKGYATNEPGNKWYLTSDNIWVWSGNVKEHTNHTISVGECINPGCDYLVNVKTKTFSNTKYVTNKTSVPLRNKPFKDAPIVYTCADSNTLFTINCKTTNLDEVWYRTSDGNWIQGGNLSEHKHTFKNGVCSVCGNDAPYQQTNISATIFQTKKDNVNVWSKPYNKTQKKRVIEKSETKLVIIAEAINYYDNKWYKLSDGSWVYSGDIELSKGSSVKQSNVAKLSTFILTVKDTSNNPIAGANVTFLDATYTTDSNGNTEMLYVTGKETLTIEKDGFNKYTKADFSMSSSRRGEVTLSKSGSYAAINVNLTHNGETKDVLKSSKNLNQAVVNLKKFSVECVVGDTSIIGKYELRQGNKSYVSTNGKFEDLTAKSFSPKKTIKLVIYDKDGKQKSTQNLLINILNETGARLANEVSFAGNGIEVKFGDGAPGFLHGASFSIPLPSSLPVEVNVTDDSIQGAVNFTDLASKDDNDKNEKFWKDLKKLKKSGFKKFYNKNKKKDLNKKDGTKNPLKPDVEIGGYVEYALDGTTSISGTIFVELSWGTSKEFQIVTAPPSPVPVCGEWAIKGKVTPSGQIVITEWQQVSGSIDLGASLTLSIGAGLGYANVASVMGYGAGTLSAQAELIPNPELERLSANATIGVKVKLLGKELLNHHVWDTRDLVMVEDGVWVLEFDEETQSYQGDIEFVAMDRSYLNNRSGWNEDTVDLFEESESIDTDDSVGVEISDYDYSVLQNSTYTDIRPQIVTSNNTIMMIYLDDAAERTDADRTMLVYSLYSTEANEWTAPQPVFDDATADFGFNVVSNGEKIYVVWQNAKGSLSDEMDIKDIGIQTEISIASYDPVADKFDCIETITDNNDMEIMPHVAAIDDNVIVTWVTNSENDPFALEGNNTINYAYKDENEYAPIIEHTVDDSIISDVIDENEAELEAEDEVVAEDFVAEDTSIVEKETGEWTFVTIEETQPWITSLDVGYLDDIGSIAFTTDMDGDSLTIDDQNIYVIDTSTNEIIEYTDQAMNVEFTTVHGDNAMTWYNQGYIYYALDTESAPQMIYSEAAIPAEEYHIISDDMGNMAILYAPKAENSSNATVILYDDETYEWGLPIAVTKQNNYIQNFNGAYYDGAIVSVFNNTVVSEDTWLETNDLCTAIIGERHDIKVTNVHLSDINLVPGEDKEIFVDVQNNGTVRTSKLQLTIFDGDEIVSEQTIDKVIKSGDTETIETTITLPSVITKNTYRIAVEEVDIQDTRITDNYFEYTIGKSSLNIEAVASPTEDENIVVITVTNKGYEPSSGSIVLYDNAGNILETLLENFEELENGESVDCAFVVGDEYFNDKASTVLAIGVIPNVEQDTNSYCQTSVIVNQMPNKTTSNVKVEEVNLGENSTDEVALLEDSKQSISGMVANNTDVDITEGTLHVIAYDSRGIYLDTYSQDVSVEAKSEIDFTAVFENDLSIEKVKIMLVKKGTIIPLVDTSVIEIDDLSEENTEIDYSEIYDVIITDEEEY